MTIKLLFVDDDEDFIQFLKAVVKKHVMSQTYEVYYALNAEDALAMVHDKDKKIDIVFLDINMPGTNGFTLLTEINKVHSIVKVVMMSADSNITTLRTAMNKDAYDFIVKPFGINDLELTVEKTYQHIVSLRDAQDKLEESYVKLKKTMAQTIHSVSAIGEMRDPYTAGHQKRVAQLAKAIGQEMGFDEDRLDGIYICGLLHDIGKICIPTEILSKPGGVSEHEFTLIRDHAQAGYEILKRIDFPWPIAEIVRAHHERIDGSGYPQGLKGDELPDEAKIIAVADAVEAIASYRPYRPALGIDKALDVIIQEKGTLYDPHIVDVCVYLFREKSFQFED